MGSVMFKLLAGALAGLLAWVLLEPMAPADFQSRAWASWELMFMIALSGFIGIAVGGINGWQKGSKMHALREAGLGALFGTIGGGLGASVGSSLLSMLHLMVGVGGVGPMQMAARIIAITPIGLFIGAGIGAATISWKGTVQGALGGGIAGAVAGLAFDPIGGALAPLLLAAQGKTSGEVGGPSRAVLAVLLGAGIGLFIGLAQRLLRSAWVRLNLGRNEGKEWAIDRPQMTIGRSEGAQIPLFGDPQIAPNHAYIIQQNGGYILADAGSPMGTYLNGQRISQAPLFHGAQIGLGATVLQFLMKDGAVPHRGPEAQPMAYPIGGGYAPQPQQPAPQQPMPGQPIPGQPMPGQPMPGQPVGAQPWQQPMPQQAPLGMTQAYGASPAMAPTMMGTTGAFALVPLDGPMAGQKIPVRSQGVLGREGDLVAMAYDGQASRRHAVVAPAAFGLTVQDSASTNGTFVNGQRVMTSEARPGDILKIGNTSFRVETL